MYILIKVKPRSHQEKIEKIDDAKFVAWVRESPHDGLANKGVIQLVADYFKVAPSRISIKKGLTSKNKTVEIL